MTRVLQSPKRAVIYTRVSTERQADEGYSLDAQDRILRDYCLRHGYEVVSTYSDEGLSGKDIQHRPGIQALLNDAKSRNFDILLVWKLTRFTRSISDLCRMCDLLEKYGVAFVSYSESFECTTPTGRLMLYLLGIIAQFDRDVISQNVSIALDERAAQGGLTFVYALGYDVKRIFDSSGSGRKRSVEEVVTVNHVEAEIIRAIHEKYLETGSVKAVVEMCAVRNYKGKHGRVLKKNTIYRILERPLYSGYLSWKGMVYRSEKIPVIIPAAMHNDVQRLFEKQYKMRGHRKRINPLIYLDESLDNMT